VIARVNHARNVDNIYRAGADFALSISRVSGQMLSYRLLGQETASLYQNLRVQLLSAAPFAGRTPRDPAIRARGGCSVVAVRRGGDIVTALDSGLLLDHDDSIYACGTNDGLASLRAAFPDSR
jgi:Trk K+ transport system NAD-binding subunit